MSEEIINTKNGVYGRVQVTLPLQVKSNMLAWSKKSGLTRAQFLRTALMIGAAKLAEDIKAKSPSEAYFEGKEDQSQEPART